MLGEPAAKPHVSHAEYLALEEKSLTKHEWLDGVVSDLEARAMAGGTPDHAGLAAAVTVLVGVQLRGKPCRAFPSDLEVQVPATGLSTYADVTIVCGKLETAANDANAVTNPAVLIEVLSDSTEAYDRGEKFAHWTAGAAAPGARRRCRRP
jgi:Uma2 family endonuclease